LQLFDSIFAAAFIHLRLPALRPALPLAFEQADGHWQRCSNAGRPQNQHAIAVRASLLHGITASGAKHAFVGTDMSRAIGYERALAALAS